MPLTYANRPIASLVRKRVESDRFLGREITGYLSGLFFYLRHANLRRILYRDGGDRGHGDCEKWR
jgi:hypothetical protein